MNTKIFTLLTRNLLDAFNLPKYSQIVIDEDTEVEFLPWTPARYKKFKDAMEKELQLPCDYVGTLKDITHELSEKYILIQVEVFLYARMQPSHTTDRLILHS